MSNIPSLQGKSATLCLTFTKSPNRGIDISEMRFEGVKDLELTLRPGMKHAEIVNIVPKSFDAFRNMWLQLRSEMQLRSEKNLRFNIKDNFRSLHIFHNSL
jgi:hypothetical protein